MSDEKSDKSGTGEQAPANTVRQPSETTDRKLPSELPPKEDQRRP